ncbi:hypothetical protein HU742_005350 [Pseudomonas sp. SWRI102]|uniref:Uncharacterized protein n=1 Tax=Pseudomonas marvdashtae TaxID=2745500 RepID=A0A923JR25_9PSED|nr:hypothetical protein [Pseudomonas marvdashtae]MBV4550571.1 hypothetical protein [Pseudomonas marvdashtae]
MNSSIRANDSLVINGDFAQSFSHWRKGPTNPSWLGIDSEMYNGEMIRLLSAGNSSSVSQPLTAPKDPGIQARYILTFLCEMRHAEAGTLRIEVDGREEQLDIPLSPGQTRNAREDQARLKSGELLEFLPKEYQVELDLSFNEQDTLIVSVFSPPNAPGDYISAVCIARIKLHLHLDPVVMQVLKLDEQSLAPTGPLYICLGATESQSHQLEFIPEPDSIWLGTQAALTDHDNPLEAIVATPAWGENQPLDLPWTLDCPLIGEDEPYLFSMDLLNQYTADPYPLEVSLGHHRLAFLDVREAAYYPVLEYEQSVRLGVQVGSYYTHQTLSGRTVNWTVTPGQVKTVALTDDQGWAYFDYQPTRAGQFEIEASVKSLYYATGVVTQALAVRVLETDPWNDVLVVVEGEEARWDEKTGYPNRGTDYALDLKLPAASPLLGTDLSLHWSGDPHEQLRVVVEPALEVAVPVLEDRIIWTLICEDELDGRFYLELACSKLLLPSPKKTMSLARNLVRVGEVRGANKFPIVDENESVLLRVQVVHVIAAGDGDPVVNARVEWKDTDGPISSVPTGAGGWASVLYQPRTAGDKVVTASIKAHAEAVAVEHPFDVKAIATSPWKNEVTIFLDELEVERNALGVLCRRGRTHTLKVVPNSGSSWIGKNISLHWRGAAPDIGLEPADLGTPKPLVADGAQWTLSSQVNGSTSSLFELELRLESVSAFRELAGRLVSESLAEEVSLRLDQIPAQLNDQALYPCLGALHRFSVLPNALSPLVGLASILVWSGTSAEQLNATVEPPLANAQPVNDGGAIWTLDFTVSEQSGQFALAWGLPQLDFAATAKPMMLGHNKVRIQDRRDSPVDPVVGQAPAWLWVQVFSHFTELAVDQVPVSWRAGGAPTDVSTDADGWSGFALAPSDAQPHEVTASVSSPYDDFENPQVLTVTPLADDPWAALTVQFDGKPPQRWGEKTYFPRRKGSHNLMLQAPENSPLFNHEVTLGLTGSGPAELGLEFLPSALGVARKFPREGLDYAFKVNDLKDGSFALRLSATRLAHLSPANAMSVGSGSQALKLILSGSALQVLDWESELYAEVKLLSAINGKPMAGWTVTWRSPDLGEVTSVTNWYGVAKVCFVPVTPGAAQLTATVGDEAYSESVTLSYFLNEPREIQSLTSPKPNGHLGELVSAVVTVVSALTGEPLQGVEVMWDYPSLTLAPTSTDDHGQARVAFNLPSVRRGLLVATVRGGYVGWEVEHIEFELVPDETTWSSEFTPYVNNTRVQWPEIKLNVFAGQLCTLKLDYKDSWLIGDPNARILLEYKPGEEAQDLVVDPPLGQPVAMEQGSRSLSWSISTDQAHNRAFVLQFAMPLMNDMPTSPPVPGITRDEDSWLEEFTFYLNGQLFELEYRDLHLIDGTNNTWELRIKEGSSLIDTTSVALGAGAGNPGVEFDPPLYLQQPVTATPLSWSILTKEAHHGSFMVELRSPDLPMREVRTEVKP